MTMPGAVIGDTGGYYGGNYFGENLAAFVQNNTISMARLDDMATRIVAAWYYMHQDEGYPELTINSWNFYDPINTKVNVESDHASVIKEVATAGIVLLKNEGALPLHRPQSMVLVGSDAAPPVLGPNEYPDQGGDPTGILAMGWGSGCVYFSESVLLRLLIGCKDPSASRIWYL
jgi:beta-glucosidase-like glycosyl hydrolase